MREILFRGKWIDNGEWVEGYPVKYPSGKVEIFKSCGEPPDILLRCEMDPETICQYTGLNDKNGNRIYENDIVRCNRREKEAKYKVVWDKTYADFRVEKLNGLGIMPICIEEGGTPVFGRHYECIGNIFDNPELME